MSLQIVRTKCNDPKKCCTEAHDILENWGQEVFTKVDHTQYIKNENDFSTTTVDSEI